MDVIQSAGDFFAITRNERHSCAFIKQDNRSCNLFITGGQFVGQVLGVRGSIGRYDNRQACDAVVGQGQTDLVRRLAPADNNEPAEQRQGTNQQPSRRRSREEFAFDAPRFRLTLAAATRGLTVAAAFATADALLAMNRAVDVLQFVKFHDDSYFVTPHPADFLRVELV